VYAKQVSTIIKKLSHVITGVKLFALLVERPSAEKVDYLFQAIYPLQVILLNTSNAIGLFLMLQYKYNFRGNNYNYLRGRGVYPKTSFLIFYVNRFS